ncbi:hypothetical protein L914_02651 [Phytophthora nicotianae]|uniref:PiggyBac transposable element-derived protein domain-containing protein n=1 Tax=Phytophthora nicotianae TaxID=4792 RepID=W2NYT5_PHYNI|nr:hypothetical protein L914_02651 [Phytophthora nicotianae]
MLVRVSARTKAAAQASVSASALDLRLVDFGHLWRQLKAAGWRSKPPTGLSKYWAYIRPSSEVPAEGEIVFYGEKAVVEHAIATGLIQDDENNSSGEESGDGGEGESGGGGEAESGGGDRGDGEMVRASQIDCNVALSANTVDALFGSNSEDDGTPALSQNAVGRAFGLSPLRADAVHDSHQSVVIGAFQRLLSETEPDQDSEDDSVKELRDASEGGDAGGPVGPRDPADVNLMKPGDLGEEYESLSSGSDYGQFLTTTTWSLSVLSQTRTGYRTTRIRLTWMPLSLRPWVAPCPSSRWTRKRCETWPGARLRQLLRTMGRAFAEPVDADHQRDEPHERQTVNHRARHERARTSRTENMHTLRELRRRIRGENDYSPREILRVIGLLVAHMLNPTRRVSQHWAMTDDGALSAGAFGKYMNRNRCKSILRDRHFTKNDNPNCQDKLWKIRDVVDVLQERFLSAWTPPNIISFDEGVLPATSRRNTTRMFMPDKPHRYGTKMFEIYVRKHQASESAAQAFDHKTGAAAVIRNLSTVLAGHRGFRVVVIDRFYSSVALAIQLLSMSIYVFGTIMTNHLGFNREVVAAHKTRPRCIERGSFKFARTTTVPTMGQDPAEPEGARDFYVQVPEAGDGLPALAGRGRRA